MLHHAQSRWESIFRLITDLAVPPASQAAIEGRNILITGAGGSIGSTLAHALCAYKPLKIILLDASEQSLYRIDRDLRAPHAAVLGSVCDGNLLVELMERFRPQIVFHAAAFKHVPLMELNPFAALQNNAAGTFMLAQCAVRHRVDQVVMVSTDKAVEPASIMGGSKRIAELICVAMPASTRFKAVRLGNVLASEGSVVQLFERQIDRGQPLTVTHVEATRYFLTMEGAAQLLMLALSDDFASGIFVPELGEPVAIEKIARGMLAEARSSLDIVFTGLRPGDKLTEKLISDKEAYLPGADGPLRRLHSPSVPFEKLEAAMQELTLAVERRDLAHLMRVVSRLVPGYAPSEVIGNALREVAAAR